MTARSDHQRPQAIIMAILKMAVAAYIGAMVSSRLSAKPELVYSEDLFSATAPWDSMATFIEEWQKHARRVEGKGFIGWEIPQRLAEMWVVRTQVSLSIANTGRKEAKTVDVAFVQVPRDYKVTPDLLHEAQPTRTGSFVLRFDSVGPGEVLSVRATFETTITRAVEYIRFEGGLARRSLARSRRW